MPEAISITPYDQLLDIKAEVEDEWITQLQAQGAGVKPYDTMQLFHSLGDEAPSTETLKALNQAAGRSIEEQKDLWANFNKAISTYPFRLHKTHKSALKELYKDYMNRYQRRRDYEIFAQEIARDPNATTMGLRPQIEDMPREDRPMFMAILRKHVKKQERGFFKGLSERFWRGTTSMIESLKELPVVAGLSDGDKSTWYRQARSVALGADPVEATQGGVLGLAERGLYGAAEMVPNLLGATGATALTGGTGGVAWWFAQIAPQEYAELRMAGVPDGHARTAAIISAVPQALVEMLQFKRLTPFLRHGAQRAATRAIRPGLMPFVTGAAKEYTIQVAQEGIQAGIGMGVKGAASYLTRAQPGVDWGEEIKSAGEEVLEAALSMPFLMIPGTATQAVSDIRAARGMQALQEFTPDLIAQLANVEVPEGKKGPSRKTFKDLGITVPSEEKRGEIVQAAKSVIEEERRRAEQERQVAPYGEAYPGELPGQRVLEGEAGPDRVRREAGRGVAPIGGEAQPVARAEAAAEEAAPGVEPPKFPKEPIPVAARGSDTTLQVVNFEEDVPASRAVVELETLVPSDNLWTEVPESNVEAGVFPAETQPRDYSLHSPEVADALEKAKKFEPRQLLSLHPDPTAGPPSVHPTGIVLNGNKRTMILQHIAATGKFDEYKNELMKQAKSFGLDPTQIENMKWPVLVRMVDMHPQSAEAIAFARAGNIPTTMAQSPVRQAAAFNSLIDEELISDMSIPEGATFSEVAGTHRNAKGFRQALKRRLPSEQVPQFFSEDDNLTEAGKELVRHMLLTRLFSVDLVERLGEERKNLKHGLEASIPQLLKFRRDYPDMDIIPQLTEAVWFEVRHPRVNVDQMALIPTESPISSGAAMMVDFLRKRNKSGTKMLNAPRSFRNGMKSLMADLEHTRDLLRQQTPTDMGQIAAKALDIPLRENAKFGPPPGTVSERDNAFLREAEQTRADVMGKTEEREPEYRATGPMYQPPYNPIRPDVVPAAIQAPRQEIEERIQKTTGAKPPSWAARMKEVGKTIWNRMTRAREFLPNTKRWATANEVLRLLRDAKTVAVDQTMREMAGILDALGPNQYEVFQRKVYLDNHYDSVKRGEPLRDGYESLTELEQHKRQVDLIVEQVPEVQEALKARHAMTTALVKEAVAHDVLPPEALERTEVYMHQQILTKLQFDRLLGRAGIRKKKRGFQKARVKHVDPKTGEIVGPTELDELYDYNKNYIESEFAWMTGARVAIQEEKTRRILASTYDISPQLKAEAKALRDSGENPDATWEDFIPEKHSIFQYQPGNALYPSFTIPERIVEELQKAANEGIEITKDMLRRVLAVGGPHTQYVFPDQLSKQLWKMEKPKLPDSVQNVFQGLLRSWKRWTLLNPKRALAYNLRNLTGDIDPVIATGVGALKKVPAALKELIRYHGGYPSISENLENARDLAVISSSITAVEIPVADQTPMLRRFYKSKQGAAELLTKPASEYWNWVRNKTELRENVLRYASYLDYLEKLESGKPFHHGGARKAVVDEIAKDLGNEAAAAHLSRNLLGDYGNMTVMGEWLRMNLIPFWSWQEINFKRWPRLFINSAQLAKVKGMKNKAASALYTGLAVSRLAWLFGGIWLWNHLMFPDEEDDLPIYDRANPHIIFGRKENGNVVLLRNVGALSDMFEWFGIDSLMSLYPRYRDRQLTGGDIAKEMLKSPINKAFQALRPELKAFEVATGQSYFPDIFNPRHVPHGEAAAGILGLVDEWRGIKGLLLGKGDRMRENYWERFLGVADPKRTALNEIYQLRDDYLKSKGKERPAFYGVSETRNMRRAAMVDSYDAFKEAMGIYLDKGKTAKNFRAFLKHLDPISQRLNNRDEYAFVNEFLNSIQREKLKVARDYSQELRLKLWRWWKQAYKELK